MNSMRWIAMLVVAAMLSACGSSRPEPQPSVAPESHSLFVHWMVDATPPGGAKCCTDVIAAGDVNGDGFADAVVGGQEAKGAGLVWYEYPTWRRHDVAKGEFTTDGQLFDLDRDGDLDIVIGDLDRGVLWYENRNHGGTWIKHVVAAGYTHDIAVFDVDGDGSGDIVTTDKKRVRIFYSAAAAPRQEQIIERAGEGLQIADLDGDGDPDILYSNAWLEQQRSGGQIAWRLHDIDRSWNVDTRIQVVDVNGDGKLDVVLSGSEGESRLAWFEAPAGDISAPWVRHYIGDETFVGAHSLRAADFDLDGSVDVVVAEMSTSPQKRIRMYLNRQAGAAWRSLPLATHGSHNMVAADVDGDGDVDLLGKNYEGAGRFVEYWENRSADLRLVPTTSQLQPGGGWRYQPIDSHRPSEDAHKFGLLVSDLDRDGHPDVVAGGSVYFNPGQDMGQPWRRVQVAPQSDVIHVTPHRRNQWPLMLAVTGDALELVEARSANGTEWTSRKLHRLPYGRTQGYVAGEAAPDGDYDFFFSHATSLFQVHITSQDPGKWRFERLKDGVQEEGLALGDLDGDGRRDLVMVDADGKNLVWLEPDGRGTRVVRHLGASLHWIDRVAIADVNKDGRLDVIYTEETRDWDYNARLVWLEAPVDRLHQPWRTHVLTVLRSINSLSVHDVDGDGSVDLLFAEHTDMRPGQSASDNFTGLLHNRGDGTFVTEVVEIGPHASHLGAQLLDPGGGAPLQIVSTGWEQMCCVHRWIAPAVPPSE